MHLIPEPRGDPMADFRQAFGIYHVLEVILREANKPLTCVEIFDNPDVRKFANDADRVSNHLGHMWRRSLLDRVPAPKTGGSQAKWAYVWKGKLSSQAQDIYNPPNRLKVVEAEPVPEPTATNPAVLLNKPNIEISNNGELVTIDLPALVITIRTK